MTPLSRRRLLRTGASAVLAAGLGIGLLTAVPPAPAEPAGVGVPVFRGGAVVAWGDHGRAPGDVPASLDGKIVTAVAGGNEYSVALTSDGRLTIWGSADEAPAELLGKTVTAIAAGSRHVLALTSDGVVTAWGDDGDGQSTVPPALAGRTVTAIAAGGQHSLALTNDGRLTGWGLDQDGEATPPASLDGKVVTAIAAGDEHSLALTSDGTIAAWGEDNRGQATVPDSLVGKTVTAIAAGNSHSLALTSDGTITVWGETEHGEADVPTGLAGKTVVAIASSAEAEHSLALTDDGRAWVWGADYDGQLDVPPGFEHQIVTALAAGSNHSLAVTTSFAAERAPSIVGTPLVGQSLAADAGRYTAKPDQLTYTWHADGTPVGSGSTFTPTAAQAGRRITVQVTAAKTGHAPVVTTSAASQPVIGPPTIELTTTRAALRRGQTATLTWASTFASTVTASGAWTGARTPAGTLTIKPTRVGTTSYVLTATNSAGTATARARVRVIRPAARLRVQATVGKNVRVTVRGLEAGEHYTIRLGKRKVAGGTAKNAKPLVRAVKLPKKAGRVTLRVTGDQPDRTGSVRIRVRR